MELMLREDTLEKYKLHNIPGVVRVSLKLSLYVKDFERVSCFFFNVE